jgi:sulfur carrier protein
MVDGALGRGYVPRCMLHIVVNGEERAVSEGTTVAGLLADLGLARQHVAVEANREIVPRAQHELRMLATGDRLEIVTFVGGG